MMKKFLLGSTAALAGLAAAAAAQAQTAITGGGSTLASPTYLSEFSLFQGSNDSYDFSDAYTPEGSGAAQASVINNAPAGFDFGASDATINATQLSTYNGAQAGTAGLLIEIPMIGTSITLPLNLPTVTSDTSVSLTDAQVCGIFSGKFTTWSAAGVGGLSGASNNITVGYRGDNSGTSFLFTQHLAAVCTPSTSAVTFTATQSFASVFASNGVAVPSNFHSSISGSTTTTGSPAVQYTVANTSGGVGYLSPDYTQIATSPKLASGVAQAPYVAEVNGVQPTASNTGTALQGGVPVPLNAADGSFNTSDPNSFIPVAAAPTSGYPIVGYTTWLLPQCFSTPAVASALKSFLTTHYSSASFKAIYNASGFSTVSPSVANTISKDYLAGSASSVIGTGSNCSGKAGR